MEKSRRCILFSGLLVFLFIMIACDDFLQIQPKGSLSRNTIANGAGVERTLNGAYSLLNNGGSTGAGWQSGLWLFGGVASDDAHTGTEAGALPGGPQLENYAVDASTIGLNGRWQMLYAGVQRANDVIRLIPEAIEGESITQDRAQQFEAEAVFLRGVYHLQAAMMWENIPYIDDSTSFAEDNYNVSNTDAIWPHIENDFQYAAETLTETKSDLGRANSWAAKAFLVKTYMFQDKFEEAKPLLDDIITNGVTSNGLQYGLYENYFDNFRPSTRGGPEMVFAIMLSVNDGAGGNAGNVPMGDGHAGPFGGPFPSYGFYQPSFSLANSYKTDSETGLPLLDTWNDTNINHDLNISSSEQFTPHQGTLDSRIDYVMGRRGIPYLDWGIHPGQAWIRQQSVAGPYSAIKNANPQSEPEAREGNSTANTYNLIRFADVLLWAAEVEVEIGNLDLAETYVNRVRARAANPDEWVKKYENPDDPMAGRTDEPAANYKVGLYDGHFTRNGQDYARKAVRFERKLELAMEHHRFFDLQRWDNGTGYMADVLNSYIQHELSIPDYNFFYMEGAEFTQGKNELYPIPQHQIDMSVEEEGGEPVLKQNPGY